MKKLLTALLVVLFIGVVGCSIGKRNECPSRSIILYTALEDGSIAVRILRAGEIDGRVGIPRLMLETECEELILKKKAKIKEKAGME